MSTNSKITLGILFLIAAVGVSAWWQGHIRPNSALLKSLPQQPLQMSQPDQLLQNKLQPNLTKQVLAATQAMPEVKDSTAVVLDRDIYLALKVSGLDRLILNKIRQTAHQKVAKLAPGYEIHVTTDKKIFFQLQQIEQQLTQNQNTTYRDLKAKLKRINEKMKG